jgi:hypothetical protein
MDILLDGSADRQVACMASVLPENAEVYESMPLPWAAEHKMLRILRQANAPERPETQ